MINYGRTHAHAHERVRGTHARTHARRDTIVRNTVVEGGREERISDVSEKPICTQKKKKKEETSTGKINGIGRQ